MSECSSCSIDLVGLNREAHAVTIKEATIWSIVWMVLSLSFNALIWHVKGPQAALEALPAEDHAGTSQTLPFFQMIIGRPRWRSSTRFLRVALR